MGLKDELDSITEEKVKKEAQMLSEDEVYNILLESMYNQYIVEAIKKGVSEGKTLIEGEFWLCYEKAMEGDFKSSRVSREASIYEITPGYDSEMCGFRELFVYHKPALFKREFVEITPLGERVYKDLKRMAQEDQVTLSEPYPVCRTELPYGGSLRVRFSYKYER